jgi:hypothetical protein
MKLTRTAYYAMHATPWQRYPLLSGAPFRSVERAQREARTLVEQGYCGWIVRLHEMQQEDWPDDQWRIDHSVDEAILWLEPF